MHSNRLLHQSRIPVAKEKRDDGQRKREGGREVEGEGERDGDGGKRRRSERGGEKSQKPPHNNAREKSEHFPPKDGPFPNPCALSDKLK